MDSTTILNLFYAETGHSKAQWSQMANFGGGLIYSVNNFGKTI